MQRGSSIQRVNLN